MTDQHTPPAPGDAMKTPIEPEDIREGDLIRCESVDGSAFGSSSRPLVASEFIAGRGFRHADHGRSVRYFLLDRPAPAVELPAEPTLGWLTTDFNERILAKWRVDGSNAKATDGSLRWVNEVTGFTPAVAVPAEALEKLREAFDTASTSASAAPLAVQFGAAIADFLGAVDAANGDAS